MRGVGAVGREVNQGMGCYNGPGKERVQTKHVEEETGRLGQA